LAASRWPADRDAHPPLAEHGKAHELLGKAVSDLGWQAASQDLDELLRSSLVVARLLAAEERLAKDDEERGCWPLSVAAPPA
jgi:hypothetical protein